MLTEMDKEQDEANVSRLSFPRPFNGQRNRLFRPRNPATQYNPRQAVSPRVVQYRPPFNPCQLCLQAGKPEYIARSHSYSQCQLIQPRYQSPFKGRTPAMRLIAASDTDQTLDGQHLCDGSDFTQERTSYLPEFH